MRYVNLIIVMLVISISGGCKTLDNAIDNAKEWYENNHRQQDESSEQNEHQTSPSTSTADNPAAGSSSATNHPATDNWQQIKWIGHNFSRAKLDKVNFSVVSANSHGIRYHYDKLPKSRWRHKTVKTTVNAITCIFDKDLRGGKFEWIRPGQRTRTFHNIHNGYISGFKLPAKGEIFYSCIVSTDGKYRSELVKSVMQ